MNLPKREEIKYKNELRRINPRSESPMETELYEAFLRKGLRFHKQFPIGSFFADLAYPDIMLVVEYDGKEFHDEEKDKQRDAFMKKLGWMVLRVRKIGGMFMLGEDIMCQSLDKIVEEIDDIFEQRRYNFGHERKYASENKEFINIINDMKGAYQRIEKRFIQNEKI